MRTTILSAAAVAAVVAGSSAANAEIFFADFFGQAPFAEGPLAGQNGWSNTGTGSGNDPVIQDGRVRFGGSLDQNGQNVGKAFTFPGVQGSSFVFALDIVFEAVPTGTSSFGSLLIESSPSGFGNFRVQTQSVSDDQFGILFRGTGQGANPFVGPGAPLNVGQAYTFVGVWDVLSGDGINDGDVVSIYIDPTENRTENTPYLTQILAAGSLNPTGLQQLVFDQFSNFPAVSVGAAVTGNDFSDVVTTIPEPATASLLALGGLAALRRRRA